MLKNDLKFIYYLDNKYMNIYLIYLLSYVIHFSIMDFFTNKFYKRIWHKKKFNEKILLIFYLLLHNTLYYCIYFTLPYILYYHNSIKINYLYNYLVLVIFVPIHWITYNNRCWLTVQQNKLLEISEDYGFRDFISIFFNLQTKSGDGGIRDTLYYLYLIICIIITIALIFYKQNINLYRFLNKS